jgi:stress response protein YsnF
MEYELPFSDKALAEFGLTREQLDEAKRKIETGEIQVDLIIHDEHNYEFGE